MIIETERLVLRPFVESDAADVYEYLKEPAVNCFASMRLNSLDEAIAEMKKRSGETEYYFAIVLKKTGTFMWRANGKPTPSKTSNPFKDVKSGDYYCDAVLWAVEKGITLGTDATHFSPSDTCTRGQVVTFLYRAVKE